MKPISVRQHPSGMSVVWLQRAGLVFWLLGTVPCVAQAQTGPSPATPTLPAAQAAPVEDKRVFGVIPNNRTTEASLPFTRISAKRKLTIAYKDSFDWPVYPTSAAFALLY